MPDERAESQIERIRVGLTAMTPMVRSMIGDLLQGAPGIRVVNEAPVDVVVMQEDISGRAVRRSGELASDTDLATVVALAPMGIVTVDATCTSGASYQLERTSVDLVTGGGHALVNAVRAAGALPPPGSCRSDREPALPPVGAIEFAAVRAFRNPDEHGGWSFLPLQLDLQRGDNGDPLISLFEQGASGQLSFASLWQANPDHLSALKRLIGRVDAAGAELPLAFAAVASPRCRVLIGDGAGSYSLIGTSETSGYPPYQALFNLSLTGAELEHARAALRGEPGQLKIEYTAELLVPQQDEARLNVDTARLSAWLSARQIDSRTSSEVIEQAISQGLIRVTCDAGNVLAPHRRQQLIAAAERMLPTWLSSHDAGLFELSLAGRGVTPVALRLSADIGQLLAPTSS